MTALILFLGFLALVSSGITWYATSPKKELAPPPTDLPALACDALVTRVFEDRLVTAGIMEVADMTVCDTPVGLCKDCEPTHREIARRETAAANEQRKRNKELKEKNGIKSVPLNRPGRKRLTVGTPGGITVVTDWPRSVPEYAAVQYLGEAGPHSIKVGFRWIEPDTGDSLVQTMLVPTIQWDGAFTRAPSDHRRRPGTSGLSPERHAAAVKSFGRGIPDDGNTYS